MKNIILSLCLTLSANLTFGQAKIDSVLMSDVKFKNSKFDNPHAGSGFLIKYKNKLYACTAKHVLFFAKTDSMKTISFGDALKSWEFISKTNSDIKITTGKLINENPLEPIAMPPIGDWLIFEISGKIPKGVVVYSLRETTLKKGQEVYFLGYPYKSNEPIEVQGKYIGLTADNNNNLSLDVPKGNYGGCSGGPVLDSDGKVVGLVSMGYYDEKSNTMIFEPASTNYFKEVINNYEKNNQ